MNMKHLAIILVLTFFAPIIHGMENEHPNPAQTNFLRFMNIMNFTHVGSFTGLVVLYRDTIQHRPCAFLCAAAGSFSAMYSATHFHKAITGLINQEDSSIIKNDLRIGSLSLALTLSLGANIVLMACDNNEKTFLSRD
jgi:hypothetical protein